MIKKLNSRIMRSVVLVVAIILLFVAFNILKSQGDPVVHRDFEQPLFSNEVRELPPAIPTTWDIGRERYVEQVKEYSDLAIRFWGSERPRSISFVKEFDTDNDGITERVVGLCDLWGNHCPHEIIVIKGDKQVFSTTAGLAYRDIVPTDDGSGFYLLWDSKEMRVNGLAQSLGYVKTYFTYEDGQYKPKISEEI